MSQAQPSPSTGAATAGGLTPLAGGWSGETFLGEYADQRAVVRIYAGRKSRGDQAAQIDAAVMRLVRGLIPVPAVLDVRPRQGEQPGLLITEFLPGVRADLLLEELTRDSGTGSEGSADSESRLATLGEQLGLLAATLAGMPHLVAGEFVDAELTVRPWTGDLPAYLLERAEAVTALGWTDSELSTLTRVVDAAADDLDRVGRVSLVHSDLNPKNVLVDRDSLTVTGLVDWEFAHVGCPYTDLGNLLRFDRHPVYVEAVVAAYTSRFGGEASAVLDLARAADLWALIELATRAETLPGAPADRARTLLRAVARTGDRHALPTS